MAVSKKNDIMAQAMGSFQTKEFPIGNAAIKLRELSVAEQRKLDETVFEMKEGEFVVTEGRRVVRKDFKHWDEHWIAATATTADGPFTVEELIPWPASLKTNIADEARKLNGIEPADKTAKNS